MNKNIFKKLNRNKGLTLTEVLITALISLIILSIFYMLFRGINLEARYAETWSDINNIVNGINSKIKQEMISCEYMFDRNDSDIILTRLVEHNNFLPNSDFPQIQSSISDFSQLNFPNNNVGNRIMFLKFLGYITLSNDDGKLDNDVAIPDNDVAIPKYQIVMIYLSPSNINFKGYNLNLINPVISKSEHIYSNETLKSLNVISDNLKNQIQNYIFIDKDNINNLNNFFVKYDPSIDPPWQVYDGIIRIVSNEVIMKAFSYNNIFYSIAYNRNISPFNNLGINYRVPVWVSPNDNFPSGLEFIVIGDKTARKLYVRTAVIAQVQLDRFYFQADNAVINFSDKF